MESKSRDSKCAFFLLFPPFHFPLIPFVPTVEKSHPRLPAALWITIRSWMLPPQSNQTRWVNKILPKLSFYQHDTRPGNVSITPPHPPTVENTPWELGPFQAAPPACWPGWEAIPGNPVITQLSKNRLEILFTESQLRFFPLFHKFKI